MKNLIQEYQKYTKSLFCVTALFVVVCLQSTSLVFAKEVEKKRPVIGVIKKFISKKPELRTLWGEETEPEGREIFEGDSFFTVAGQHILIQMKDDTQIILGPSSKIRIDNWFKRDEKNRLIRSYFLEFGLAWFKVKSVYSQYEPMLVQAPQGVVAVRGTEFVVEAGEGGHLVHSRRFWRSEVFKTRGELEVHTLEGEVHLAKHRANLWKPNKKTILRAGYSGMIRKAWSSPRVVHGFAIDKYKTYLSSTLPAMRLVVNRDTTNEQRAIVAGHFEKVERPEAGPLPGQGGRAIASEPIEETPRVPETQHTVYRQLRDTNRQKPVPHEKRRRDQWLPDQYLIKQAN